MAERDRFELSVSRVEREGRIDARIFEPSKRSKACYGLRHASGIDCLILLLSVHRHRVVPSYPRGHSFYVDG
jgi:hypothetical protein